MRPAILFLIALIVPAIFAVSCKFQFTSTDPSFQMNADFDISQLKHSPSGHRVADGTPGEKWNKSYILNFCDNVLSSPVSGKECHKDKDVFIPRPAFQVDEPTGGETSCYHLGDNVENQKHSLLDAHNPAAGLQIQYVNGHSEWCEASNRSLTIRLHCKTTSVNIPEFSPVVEESKCHYVLDFYSSFACPKQCGMADQLKLCSENGICAMDNTLHHPTCMCNTGFWGKSCENIGIQDDFNTTTIVLIVMACFLAVILIVIVIVWLRIKSLRLDPTVYNTLGEDTGAHSSTAEYQAA